MNGMGWLEDGEGLGGGGKGQHPGFVLSGSF